MRTTASLVLLALTTEVSLGQLAFDRVRFYPRAGDESRMVGGQFSGSNEGETSGEISLVTITNPPAAGQWTELSFTNPSVYRWVKYAAPAGAYGNVAEVEFYSGTNRLTGLGFGTAGAVNGNDYTKALDGNTGTYFDSDLADGQYVGIDLGVDAQVAPVAFDPPAGSYGTAQTITLSCATPGASIRYSLDGLVPAESTGTLYSGPFAVPATTTILACGFKSGLAGSLVVSATYRIGEPPVSGGDRTFHVGNSLTDTIFNGPQTLQSVATSAGYKHYAYKMTIPGAPSEWLWNHVGEGFGGDFRQEFQKQAPWDHLSNQPFQQRAIDYEAKFETMFYNEARRYSPHLQHWVYNQWPGPGPRANSQAMATSDSVQGLGLMPARDWEQGPINHLIYDEAICQAMRRQNDGKPSLVMPGGVALARLKVMIDNGQVPGMSNFVAETFIAPNNVHLGSKGQYLVSLVFFAAIYQRSPAGLVTAAGTGLTAEQATIYQRIAWDVVKNYVWAGTFRDGGTEPVTAPQFSPPPGYYDSTQVITVATATPGADLRVSYDGSTPTRTNGVVYVSPLFLHPGQTVKAVAYKSGFADSTVTTSGGYNLLSPMAEASFDTTATVALHGTGNGWGWYTNQWTVSNSDTTVPGCNLTTNAPLTYSNLRTTPGHAVGGIGGNSMGRTLDTGLAFFNYRVTATGSSLGKTGTTLWLSFLLRKDQDNDQAAYVLTHNGTTPVPASNTRFGAGYFGANSNTNSTRYWTLRIGSNYYKTTVPVVIGQTALLVVSVNFDATKTVNLYCNPATLGGAPPAATLTQTTTSDLSCYQLLAYLGDAAGQGALDELRMGDSYAAVTPVTTPPGQVTGLTTGTDAGAVNLSWGSATSAVAYRVYRGTNSAGPFTMIHGGVAGNSFSDTGLTPGVRYYYRIESLNTAGSGPASTTMSAVPVNAGYAAWRAANFTTGEISAGLGEVERAPAGDNLANLLKYALGISNPKTAASGTAARPGVNGQGLLTLTFYRERADVTYAVMGTANFTDWSLVAQDPGTVGADVTVPDPTSGGVGKRFLRLKLDLK